MAETDRVMQRIGGAKLVNLPRRPQNGKNLVIRRRTPLFYEPFLDFKTPQRSACSNANNVARNIDLSSREEYF
jgi:hypothetical protein